ncbi:MAG: Gfo/Idh/MocA family oxidoreductase [Candidatus Sumerlaeia bacterium]|nr:Gfo/Idh/MocA family oxidoreductase [Candidatus Sumerlaeia bacterium]
MKTVILVGFGSWGRGWYHGLHKEFGEGNVVVVNRSEPEPNRLYLGDRWYPTLEKALQKEKPEFVVNTTPPEVHTVINRVAIAHRIPILCEKPIAPTMEECRTIVAEAKVAGVPLLIAENFRRAGVMMKAKDWILLSRMGKLCSIQGTLFQELHTDKPYWSAMEHPFLEDVLIHLFDLFRFFSGSEFKEVLAHSYNPVGSWHPTNAGSQILATMQNGVKIGFMGGVASTSAKTSWMGTWRLEGEKGSLVIEGTTVKLLDEKDNEKLADCSASPGVSLIQDMRKLISGDKSISTTGEDYLLTHEFLEAALQSHRERRWVAKM